MNWNIDNYLNTYLAGRENTKNHSTIFNEWLSQLGLNPVAVQTES